MFNPTHPGVLVRREHLEPLGISVTEAARRMRMSRKSLSEFLNGRTRLSLPMARRLGAAFPQTDAAFWLRVQLQYDVAHANRIRLPKIKPFNAA
jgi:addiction module HigA family antidote